MKAALHIGTSDLEVPKPGSVWEFHGSLRAFAVESMTDEAITSNVVNGWLLATDCNHLMVLKVWHFYSYRNEVSGPDAYCMQNITMHGESENAPATSCRVVVLCAEQIMMISYGIWEGARLTYKLFQVL